MKVEDGYKAWFSLAHKHCIRHTHAQNGIFDSMLNTSSSPQANDKQDGRQSALDPIGCSPFLPS